MTAEPAPHVQAAPVWWLDHSGFWRDSVLKDLVKNAVQVAAGTLIAVACGVVQPSDEQAQALVRFVAVLYLPTVALLALSICLSRLRAYTTPSTVLSACSLLAIFGIGYRSDAGYAIDVSLLGVPVFLTVLSLYATVTVGVLLSRRRFREGRALAVRLLRPAAILVTAFLLFLWIV